MTSSTDHAALEEGLVQQLDFDKIDPIVKEAAAVATWATLEEVATAQ